MVGHAQAGFYTLQSGIHHLCLVAEQLDSKEAKGILAVPIRTAVAAYGCVLMLFYKLGDLPWGELHTSWWTLPERDQLPPIALGRRAGLLYVQIATPDGTFLAEQTYTMPCCLVKKIESHLARQAVRPAPDRDTYDHDLAQLRSTIPHAGHLDAEGIYSCEEAEDPTHLASLHVRGLQVQKERLEYQLQHILAAAVEGLWVMDRNGITCFVSNRMAEILGYAPEELMGCRFDRLLTETTGQYIETVLKRRQSGEMRDLERHQLCVLRKDGSEARIIASAIALHDDRGDYIGTVAMVTDISRLAPLFDTTDSSALLDSIVPSDRSDRE